MSWEEVIKKPINYGNLARRFYEDETSIGEEFSFHLSVEVAASEDSVGHSPIDIDERKLHGLAEEVLQKLVDKVFSKEFDDDEGNEFTVTCEITSVSENR